MPKLTKAQQKRLVKEILSKSKKLYTVDIYSPGPITPVNTQDMAAIEKLCAKWMKRIG